MKYVKIIIQIPLILISILILILIIDYIRLNLFYIINKNKYAPQGLTYTEKYNVILQTSYKKNNKNKNITKRSYIFLFIIHKIKTNTSINITCSR